ncbi:RidA family protein [bacterium]|nr:RidA family protein [bacterium]
MAESGGVIERRMAKLGVPLPPPPVVRAGYLPGVMSGNLLFLSGAVGTVMGPDGVESLPVAGKVGAEVSLEQGKASARQSAINLLAQAKAVLGDLDRIRRIVKLSGHVHAAPGFQRAPEVVNGASELLIEIFGEERGSHARISLYQHEMSLGAPIEVDLIAEVD